MIRIETHFASELVALGSARRGADDPGWRETCTTGREEALAFPRRAFVVTPGHRRATPTVLHAGLVSFARPEVEYRRALVDPAGEETDWLWLRSDVRAQLGIPSSTQPAPWHRSLAPAHQLRQRGLHALALRSAGAHEDERPDTATIESQALDLVRELELGDAPPLEDPPRAHRRTRIQRVVECIAATPHRRRSTAELAAVAGLTPSHFCVAFRAQTGRTVSAYLTELRLCTGLDRLRGRGADLSALALDLGFSSHSHFAARFRRHFGCTPSEARTLLRAHPAGSAAFEVDAS